MGQARERSRHPRACSDWTGLERRLVVELPGRLGLGAVAGALGGGGGPLQARADVVGVDLDDRAGLPLGGLPRAGLEPADHDDAVTLAERVAGDRKSTRLNSSHEWISYA